MSLPENVVRGVVAHINQDHPLEPHCPEADPPLEPSSYREPKESLA